MTRRLGLVVLLLLGSVAASRAAETPAGHVEDPVFGFSVDLPAIGDATDAITVQRLVVAGPTVKGFAPNCNVQIQYTDLGLDSYMELSRKQFVAAGLELLKQEDREISSHRATAMEYAGSLGGNDLHFSALVVAGAGRVWLVTCTALESSFAQHRASFARVLDSFRVTASGEPTGGAAGAVAGEDGGGRAGQ